MDPAGNASPVEPPLPAEKPWGNPIRWSCLKIPCHCPFHLHFPRGKTLWIGVYRPPPTSESHGGDSRLPSVGRLEGGAGSWVATGCSAAPLRRIRARGRWATAPLDVAPPDPLPGHGRAPAGDARLSHGHVVRW